MLRAAQVSVWLDEERLVFGALAVADIAKSPSTKESFFIGINMLPLALWSTTKHCHTARRESDTRFTAARLVLSWRDLAD